MHLLRALFFVLAIALVAVACGSDDDTVTTDGGDTGSGDTDITDGDDNGAGDDTDGDDNGSDDTGSDDDPFGTDEWVYARGTVDGVSLEPLPDHPATLQRRDGEVRGVAACNSYFGAFSNGPLLFGGFGITEMACEDPRAMDMELAFLQALGRTDRAARIDGALTLTGDGVELTFEVRPPTPDASLTGVDWQLDTIIEGDAATNAVGFDQVTLRFEDDGTFGGSDGCTPMAGTYSVDGDAIEIRDQVGASAQCPSEMAERTATAVVNVLSSSPTFDITGDRLSFRSGQTGLVYRAT